MRNESHNRTITNPHNAGFVAMYCRFCIATLRDSSSPFKAQVSDALLHGDTVEKRSFNVAQSRGTFS